ncbi:unnamed protein product [Trichobilharzia regenti]|nr:unnamed protein product [Trichobilharzia regenti]
MVDINVYIMYIVCINSFLHFQLSVNFPAQWIGSNLVSIYKSEDDGYCLNTVYRKCKDVEGGVLLLIRDTMGVVFGAVMSEGMKCSKGFYGTGETFVFHWKPTFKVSFLLLLLSNSMLYAYRSTNFLLSHFTSYSW